VLPGLVRADDSRDSSPFRTLGVITRLFSWQLHLVLLALSLVFFFLFDFPPFYSTSTPKAPPVFISPCRGRFLSALATGCPPRGILRDFYVSSFPFGNQTTFSAFYRNPRRSSPQNWIWTLTEFSRIDLSPSGFPHSIVGSAWELSGRFTSFCLVYLLRILSVSSLKRFPPSGSPFF